MYSYPSLFVASKLAVSQIRAVAPKTQTFPLDPTIDKSMKVVPKLDRVLVPYSRTIKELKEKQEAGLYHLFFCKEKKERHSRNNILKHRFFFGGGGGVNYSRIFVFREKRRIAWEHKLKRTTEILSRLTIRKHPIQILPLTAYFEFCRSGSINYLTCHTFSY